MFSGVSHPESSRQAKTTAAATDYIQTSPPRVFIYYSFIPPFSFLTKHSSLLSLCSRLCQTTLRLRVTVLLGRLVFSCCEQLYPRRLSLLRLFLWVFSLHAPHFLNSPPRSIPLIFPFPRSLCAPKSYKDLHVVWLLSGRHCNVCIYESCGSLGQPYYMCCSKCHCLCDSEWKTTF